LSQSPTSREQVVDTTGAGDAFAAGFVFEYLRSGGDVREALRLGCALGTCLVQRIGASATPSLEDIRSNLVSGAEGVREKH
jgi:sugar/nucleoside kinase (ribokinase family)